MPAEMIATAENRMMSFTQVKKEIDSQMAVIKEKVDTVIATITGNVQSDENPTGLLMKGEAEYLKCLEINSKRLEELMRQDEAHWAENLDMIKRQAGEIQDQIKALLEKQKQEF